MSLRDKYTDEEWASIPPFTGFHHNKNKQELINEASDALRNCDKIIFKKAIKNSYDCTKPSSFLLDEIGQMKTPCYDAPPIPLNHNDEVSPFGKVNLWDFSDGMNRDIEINKIPEKNYKFAENISVEEMLYERIKKENQPREVIQNIVDKIHERRLSGKECEVAIMSDSDYYAIQSMSDFEMHSVWISGYLLKIHASQNLKDGEIEIY